MPVTMLSTGERTTQDIFPQGCQSRMSVSEDRSDNGVGCVDAEGQWTMEESRDADGNIIEGHGISFL